MTLRDLNILLEDKLYAADPDYRHRKLMSSEIVGALNFAMSTIIDQLEELILTDKAPSDHPLYQMAYTALTNTLAPAPAGYGSKTYLLSATPNIDYLISAIVNADENHATSNPTSIACKVINAKEAAGGVVTAQDSARIINEPLVWLGNNATGFNVFVRVDTYTDATSLNYIYYKRPNPFTVDELTTTAALNLTNTCCYMIVRVAFNDIMASRGKPANTQQS